MIELRISTARKAESSIKKGAPLIPKGIGREDARKAAKRSSPTSQGGKRRNRNKKRRIMQTGEGGGVFIEEVSH